MRILVTGGAGFIGSNFVRWILAHRPQAEVVNLDKLTYAGNPANLKDLEGNPRTRFLKGDVADPGAVQQAMQGCDAVVHFAAESHVDRSIVNADDFLRTNVVGTHVLLEAARAEGVKKFLHISTDEVYGSLAEGEAKEDSVLHPNSPYSASKAASDHLVAASHATFGLPTLIVRGTNNFGPYQFPEKFLPLLITNAMEGEPLPIYGDGRYIREWLFVEDFCEAIGLVLDRGEIGEVYNVGSGERRVNLDVAQEILQLLGKPKELLRHVTDRLGHDRRYAVSSEKVRALGWSPRQNFSKALLATISWYQEHEGWWRSLKNRIKGEGCRVESECGFS